MGKGKQLEVCLTSETSGTVGFNPLKYEIKQQVPGNRFQLSEDQRNLGSPLFIPFLSSSQVYSSPPSQEGKINPIFLELQPDSHHPAYSGFAKPLQEPFAKVQQNGKSNKLLQIHSSLNLQGKIELILWEVLLFDVSHIELPSVSTLWAAQVIEEFRLFFLYQVHSWAFRGFCDNTAAKLHQVPVPGRQKC